MTWSPYLSAKRFFYLYGRVLKQSESKTWVSRKKVTSDRSAGVVQVSIPKKSGWEKPKGKKKRELPWPWRSHLARSSLPLYLSAIPSLRHSTTLPFYHSAILPLCYSATLSFYHSSASTTVVLIVMLVLVTLAPSQAETSGVWLLRMRHQCIPNRPQFIGVAGTAPKCRTW